LVSPIEPLISHLQTKDGLTTANLSGVRSQVVAPAVIFRPDEPWLEPDRYCDFAQRYVAVATVSAASAEEGVDRLFTMVKAVVENLPEGWDWDTVGAPIIDESTGTSFLVAPVRLTFKGEA